MSLLSGKGKDLSDSTNVQTPWGNFTGVYTQSASNQDIYPGQTDHCVQGARISWHWRTDESGNFVKGSFSQR